MPMPAPATKRSASPVTPYGSRAAATPARTSVDDHLILVTGATGYGGRWLVHKALEAGFRVRAADVSSPRHGIYREPLDSRAQFVLMDVRDEAQVAAAMVGVTTVFHVAAVVPYNLGRAFSRKQLFEVNVEGTERVFRAAASAGARNFILCSSTGVVFAGDPIVNGDEALPYPPTWNDAYSESKARAEEYVLRHSDVNALAAVAIRPNGIWGPGEQHHIPKLLRLAQVGMAGAAFGTDSVTDFTHRDNLAVAFLAALRRLTGGPTSRSAVAGRAYFVTDGWHCHTLEFFSPMLSGLGFTAPFPSALVPAQLAGKVGVDAKHPACARVSPTAFAALEDVVQQARTVAGGDLPPVRKGDAVIVTCRPPLSVPAALVTPIAMAMEVVAGLINAEPFLTRADVRKVANSNCYVSSAAARELGYAPVTTPAAGMVECIQYYRDELGYNGAVASPPASVWAGVVMGLSLAGAVGFNWGGVGAWGLSLMAPWAQEPTAAHLASRWAPPLRTWYAASGLGLTSWAKAVGRPGGVWMPATTTDLECLLACVATFFWAAVLVHAINAVYAFRMAWRCRLAAGAYAVQTFILGFPSTQLVVKACGGNWRTVPLASFTGFTLCIPAVLLLQTLWAALVYYASALTASH